MKMFINDYNIIPPGDLPFRLVDYDRRAYDKITAHADALFHQEKKLSHIEPLKDDARVKNPLILVANFAIAAINKINEQKTAPDHFLTTDARLNDGMTDKTPNYLEHSLAPKMMGLHMAKATHYYIERDKKNILASRVIASYEINDLVGYIRRAEPSYAPRPPEYHAV